MYSPKLRSESQWEGDLQLQDSPVYIQASTIYSNCRYKPVTYS